MDLEAVCLGEVSMGLFNNRFKLDTGKEDYSQQLGRLFGAQQQPDANELVMPQMSAKAPTVSLKDEKDFNQGGNPAAMGDETATENLANPPKQEGFFGRLFGRKEVGGGTDEYGVHIPGRQKEKIGSKILSYGLPALAGLAGGAGILPGLLAGVAGSRAREDEGYDDDVKAYNTQRGIAQRQEAQAQNIDMKKQGLDIQRKGLGIKAYTATHPNSGRSETADERFTRIGTELAGPNAKYIPRGDLEWFVGQKKIRDKQGGQGWVDTIAKKIPNQGM